MDIVHFETLGCKLNQIETESLAHAFTEAGFTVALGRETAGDGDSDGEGFAPATFRPVETPELCVVNTCTVTGKAEQKARRLIRLLLRKHPNTPILVTGCYAEVEAEAIEAIDPRVRAFPGTRKGELVNLPAWLADRRAVHPEEPLRSALAAFIGMSRNTSGDTGSSTSSTFALSTDDFLFHSRASIKIEDGCNNRCSYCRIRIARGKAVSLDSGEVVDRIRKIEEAGWGEVVLTGVNLSQYRSVDGDFADLLSRILRETDRIAIRISSLYPERVDDAILPSLANGRIRPHFHLSVQSGNDRILSLMRRPYDAQTVYRAAERLRSVKDDPFLACDIITGFPGETDDDFAATLKLCTDIGFAWIHAFPFSARPGTEAWNMRPKVPERIAGERVAILTELATRNHAAYRARWEGKSIPAIVERGHDGGQATVLTANYLAAALDSSDKPGDNEIPRGREILVRLAGEKAYPV